MADKATVEIMRIIQQIPDKDTTAFNGTYYAVNEDYAINNYLKRGATILNIGTGMIDGKLVQVVTLLFTPDEQEQS